MQAFSLQMKRPVNVRVNSLQKLCIATGFPRDAKAARFEAHLSECDGCSGYLEDMRGFVGSLHEVPEPPPDVAARDALLRAFRDLRGAC